MAETPDLGSADEILEAFPIEDPAVFSGRRHPRKGEVLWRYEGPDAVDRLEAALPKLKAHGWKSSGPGSNGVDRRPHMRMLRKGDEHVYFQYQENRESRLQRQLWSPRIVNGRPLGELEHHVKGPALDPAVYIHYRHEPSPDELRALVARAEARGGREDLIASLPHEHLVTLGLRKREKRGTGTTPKDAATVDSEDR